MKIVISLPDPDLMADALKFEPDLIEFRIDMMDRDIRGMLEHARDQTGIPLIGTLRSTWEGGRFAGTEEGWQRRITEVLPSFDFIDVEMRYRRHGPFVRAGGAGIISSYHTTDMPSAGELRRIRQVLAEYGDIPKIAVQPRTEKDVIELLSFTEDAPKPVVTSILGSRFRHFRILLPLFGSEFVFCHAGRPTSVGQYSAGEVRSFYDTLLGNGKGIPNEYCKIEHL